MRSRLYRGVVRHTRSDAIKNRFRYGIYYVYLDLDELEEVGASTALFSYNRPNVFSFWDRDHGPRDGSPLRPWIDALLAEAGIDLAGGRVGLLTFPRALGGRFYPVSFWYCFAASGEPVAVLAEVHNTFRQRHNYLLHNHGAPFDWSSKPEHAKVFHVSPFMGMNGRYQFRFTEPAERLSVSILDFIDGPLALVASIDLAARPLTDGELLRVLFRYGPISYRALFFIHWQALRLLLKGARFHSAPPVPEQETSL